MFTAYDVSLRKSVITNDEKAAMAKREIRQKTGTFGTAVVDHITPAGFLESAPRAVNVILSFEEALKLHLSLGQALGQLNSYDRTRKEGRDAAVCLGLFPDGRRIFVSEGKVRGKAGAKRRSGSEA